MKIEQGSCQTDAGLFIVLDDKFRPKQNDAILSLKYCKHSKDNDKTAEESVGRLRMKTTKCI